LPRCHLAPEIFDLTYNRIIGSLKSAKCVRLISDTHGFGKNQVDFIRRLPKNKFLLLREDLTEKPLLLQMLPDDIDRHENQAIHRHSNDISRTFEISEKDNENIRMNYEDFAQLHPIMIEILVPSESWYPHADIMHVRFIFFAKAIKQKPLFVP